MSENFPHNGSRLGPKVPLDGAEGYSLPQELEKACEAGYFLDFLIGSETGERPRFDLTSLLDSPSYLSISYCGGRETPAIRSEGRQAGKNYPSNKEGGAAIIYNKNRFELVDSEFGVPLGVETVCGVFSPSTGSSTPEG